MVPIVEVFLGHLIKFDTKLALDEAFVGYGNRLDVLLFFLVQSKDDLIVDEGNGGPEDEDLREEGVEEGRDLVAFYHRKTKEQLLRSGLPFDVVVRIRQQCAPEAKRCDELCDEAELRVKHHEVPEIAARASLFHEGVAEDRERVDNCQQAWAPDGFDEHENVSEELDVGL